MVEILDNGIVYYTLLNSCYTGLMSSEYMKAYYIFNAALVAAEQLTVKLEA